MSLGDSFSVNKLPSKNPDSKSDVLLLHFPYKIYLYLYIIDSKIVVTLLRSECVVRIDAIAIPCGFSPTFCFNYYYLNWKTIID